MLLMRKLKDQTKQIDSKYPVLDKPANRGHPSDELTETEIQIINN